MRKTLLALSLTAATAVALATPSVAQERYHHPSAAPVVGIATGTVVGVGLYNGWWTSASTATAASSVAGSAAIGGIAGVGTVAAIDAVASPCRGFHALFGGSGCVNGEYVGHQAMYGPRRHVR